MSRKALVQVLIGLTALAVVGVLFVRSVHDTRATPYGVAPEHLRNWSLAVEPQTGATAPILVLRPPIELVSSVFRQLFSRAMESLSTPTAPGMPLVLQGEYALALAPQMTPDALLAAARESGLESDVFTPRCLAYRRHSEPRDTRQLYYLLFDSPQFVAFRGQLAAAASSSASPRAFDPAALSPVVLVAASDAAFHRWLPIRSDPNSECVAPISAEP